MSIPHVVIAIIRFNRVIAATNAAIAAGATGVTVSEVSGCGDEPGATRFHRGEKFNQGYHQRRRLEIVAEDKRFAEKIGMAIVEAANTQVDGCLEERLGDGLVYIQPLNCVWEIRTKASTRSRKTTTTRRNLRSRRNTTRKEEN